MDTDGRQSQTAVEHVLKTSQHKRNTGYVLIKLAQCIDAGNNCPSHNELAEMTGLTKPTIQHALGELEKDGTITITRHGGGVKRGGKKNCYALPGMSADPVKKPDQTILPGKNDPVKEAGKMALPGKNPEDAPAHTHDAAGEQKLLSVTSSVCLSDSNQTDYQRLTDTRDVPAQTENDLKRDFEAKPPDVQAFASKAIAAAMSQQDTPIPDAAPPLPPDIATGYRAKWDTPLEGDELDKMQAIITKHGLDALKAQMAVTGKRDGDGNLIVSPAGYMLKTLNSLKAQGKTPEPPRTRRNNYRARNHDRAEDRPPERTYPDDMQFEPPPPKADMATRGVPTW